MNIIDFLRVKCLFERFPQLFFWLHFADSDFESFLCVKHVSGCWVNSLIICEYNFVFWGGLLLKNVFESSFFFDLWEISIFFILNLFKELFYFSSEPWGDKVFLFSFECDMEMLCCVFEKSFFNFFNSTLSVVFQWLSVLYDQSNNWLLTGVNQVVLLLFVLSFLLESDQTINPGVYFNYNLLFVLRQHVWQCEEMFLKSV